MTDSLQKLQHFRNRRVSREMRYCQFNSGQKTPIAVETAENALKLIKEILTFSETEELVQKKCR